MLFLLSMAEPLADSVGKIDKQPGTFLHEPAPSSSMSEVILASPFIPWNGTVDL
jgi:hypothetical protein